MSSNGTCSRVASTLVQQLVGEADVHVAKEHQRIASRVK